MLVYENNRTQSIVNRLVKIADTVRVVTVLAWAVFLAVLLSLLGVFLYPDLWWLGGLLGLAVGFALGTYTASVISIGLEWMAQVLVAQGEIIHSLNQDGKP